MLLMLRIKHLLGGVTAAPEARVFFTRSFLHFQVSVSN